MVGVVTPWKSANMINKNFFIQRPDLPTYTIASNSQQNLKAWVCVGIKGGGERETESVIKSLGVVNV